MAETHGEALKQWRRRPILTMYASLYPRSFDVLHLNNPTRPHPYRNGVEPVGSSSEVAPLDPRASGDGDRVALFTSDGLQGMAELHSAAAFYLDEGHGPAPLHDEVDFFAEQADVTVEDPPPFLHQVAFGQRLETASAAYIVQPGRQPPGGRHSGGEKNGSID